MKILLRVWWYFVGIAYGVDQLINRILVGRADHTISGRVGYWSVRGNVYALHIEPFIDALFFWQSSHCRQSIEWDEVPLYQGKTHKKLPVAKRVKRLLGVCLWIGLIRAGYLLIVFY